MKINWFSPLPPARTDIAHYTWRVLPALSARAEVTLWTDQKEWDAGLEKLARVRPFRADELNWTEFNRADVSFYNIGNNPLFHGQIWQASRRAPGVVALHDLRLHHFFDGLFRDQRRDRDGYLALMKRFYGPDSLTDAERCYDTNAGNINDMAERYPLTQAACAGALGVVAHTREAFAEVKKFACQPVAYLPLPFAAPGLKAKRAAGPPFRLVIFGYLGRNRRLAQIFAALGHLPEKEQFRLDLFGEATDRAEVETLIDETGVRGVTRVHGFVPEKDLDRALQRAHLAFNLRYPTMGEASGSQLRIWSHALPALVTRVGWYATLPADTVLFVRPDREAPDITRHLRALLTEPERFTAIGRRGREILEAEHAPEIYAESLLDMARRAAEWRGRLWAYDLAERAGALMSGWPASDGAFSVAAREIAALAGWPPPAATLAEESSLPPVVAAEPRAGWREKLQNCLDRWLLGARTG
jgi:glycosyltransferase involved in cell wall biosynthesis